MTEIEKKQEKEKNLQQGDLTQDELKVLKTSTKFGDKKESENKQKEISTVDELMALKASIEKKNSIQEHKEKETSKMEKSIATKTNSVATHVSGAQGSDTAYTAMIEEHKQAAGKGLANEIKNDSPYDKNIIASLMGKIMNGILGKEGGNVV